MELSALFGIALLAATVFPAQSEIALMYIAAQKHHDLWVLLLVASSGNILGSCITYAMGRGVTRCIKTSPKAMTSEAAQRAHAWYQRYGAWTLLASFMPIVGDAIVLMSGAMRCPIPRFLLLVTLSKTARYAAILWFYRT